MCTGNFPSKKYNKKFWEELIAYFPLIRHGLHRKRNKYVNTHRQQSDLIIYTRSCGGFFTEPLPINDKGTFTEPLLSNDKGGYTDTHTQTAT
jgi:hypothetical protein